MLNQIFKSNAVSKYFRNKMTEEEYKAQFFKTNIPNKEIDYIEVRHTRLVSANPSINTSSSFTLDKLIADKNVKSSEFLFVRQRTHFKDGSYADEFVHYENLLRPFYITKPKYRNHKQKKSREFLKKLDKYYCVSSYLNEACSRVLGKPFHSIKQIRDSLYVYGIEVSIDAIFKQFHVERNERRNKQITSNTVVMFDFETDLDRAYTYTTEDRYGNLNTKHFNPATLCSIVHDLEHEDNHVISGSKVKVELLVANDWLLCTNNPNECNKINPADYKDIVLNLFKENMPKEVPEWLKFEELDISITHTENSFDLVKLLIKRFRQINPDMVTAWNALFDFSVITDHLLYLDSSGKELYSYMNDPSVPVPYREFNVYIKPAERITSRGVRIHLDHHQRQHKYQVANSYMFIDQMCSFYLAREGEHATKGGYSLDNIGNRTIKLPKMYLVKTELTKAELHKFLSRKHKPEYGVYGMYDSLIAYGVERKTGDLTKMLPVQVDISSYDDLSSGPSKSFDDLHFFYLKYGKVLGTVNNDTDNFDSETPAYYALTKADWVVTTDQSMYIARYDNIFTDIDMENLISQDGLDNDAVSSYPSVADALGVSEDCITMEVVDIQDIKDTEEKRLMLKGMSTGKSFAGSFSRDMLKLPTREQAFNDISKMLKESNLIDDYEEYPTLVEPTELKENVQTTLSDFDRLIIKQFDINIKKDKRGFSKTLIAPDGTDTEEAVTPFMV